MFSISLQAQIRLLALFFCALGTIGFGLYAFNEWNGAVNFAYVRSSAVAKYVASSLDIGFKDYAYLLNQLASRPQTRQLASGNCDPLIRDYQSLHPELTALTVRDLKSNLICSSLDDNVATFSQDQMHLAAEAANTGSFEITGITRGEVTGRLIARMAYPVRNSRDIVAGVLLAPLDLRTYGGKILSDLPENIVINVIDRNGEIVIASKSATDLEGKTVPPRLRNLFEGPAGSLRTEDIAGVRRIGAYATVPSVGWTVTAGISESEALALPRRNVILASAAATVLFVIGLFATWIVGRNIAKPIEHLTLVVEKFSTGGSSARSAEAGPREIRQLSQRINELLERMSARR